MSGINGPGPKIGGSYENIRDKIREDSGDDDSKFVRGEGNKVYLHHGKHSIGGILAA